MEDLVDRLAEAWNAIAGGSGGGSSATVDKRPSLLAVSISSTKIAVGSNDESFREYCIECTLGSDRWHVWRRYSQFVALRNALRQRGGPVSNEAAVNEPLPAKGSNLITMLLTRHDTSETSAAERTTGLCTWLRNVVAIPAAAGSPSLLAFLGIASLETRARAPIHVRAICGAGASAQHDAIAGYHSAPETGDVLLFRTRGRSVPALQRAVTNSDWDHVGLLVYRDGRGQVCSAAACRHTSAGLAGVLEADACEGIKWYPLRGFELEWHGWYHQIAWRPLLWGGRGTADATHTLQAWFDSVEGKPYQMTVAKLLGTSSVKEGGAEEPSAAESQPAGFFCSELVAHAWKALGVLPAERPASGYWPVSFGERATTALPLLQGARLGDEVPIEFETPAVGETLNRSSGQPSFWSWRL